MPPVKLPTASASTSTHTKASTLAQKLWDAHVVRSTPEGRVAISIAESDAAEMDAIVDSETPPHDG